MTDPAWVPDTRVIPPELDDEYKARPFADGGIVQPSSELVMLGNDKPEQLIPLPTGFRISWSTVQDKLDHATLAQLRELMHGGLGDV